jgi:hypothetical integral membrane protein (TIGR02206 family)
MDQFFAKDFIGGEFAFMGTAHLITLLSIVLFNIYLMRYKAKSETVRSKIRWGMAIVLWVNELVWHIWNASVGQWNIQTMIPLHVCSVLVWFSGFMLVTKNYTIYEFAYFMGIGGALQALLTPDLGIYGFPHYRFFQTFISHGLIVTSAIYMTTVEGFRPTRESFGRIFVGMNIYLLFVFFINQAIGSNYMFVAYKPETASLLDVLPEWPWYILWLEAIGMLTCLILYIPFIIKDWRKKEFKLPA